MRPDAVGLFKQASTILSHTVTRQIASPELRAPSIFFSNQIASPEPNTDAGSLLRWKHRGNAVVRVWTTFMSLTSCARHSLFDPAVQWFVHGSLMGPTSIFLHPENIFQDSATDRDISTRVKTFSGCFWTLLCRWRGRCPSDGGGVIAAPVTWTGVLLQSWDPHIAVAREAQQSDGSHIASVWCSSVCETGAPPSGPIMEHHCEMHGSTDRLCP